MKSRKPIQERGIETRERIIAAAKDLFGEKGYYGTNSKEIARKAGVAVGTFYSYFDDKKPLFFEVLDRFYREVTETAFAIEMDSLHAMNDPRSAVHLIMDRLVKAHTISPSLHREIVAMMYLDGEVRELVRTREEDVIGVLKVMLKHMSDRIRVTDHDAAARVIHRAAEEIIHHARLFGSPGGMERLLIELEDMLCRYLFP